jgi:ABC-type nitrate/sulfonate/bicarbonate transport system ATPase subunit
MRAYLEIFNVSKSFGSYTVLKDINLLINRGEFISLIGHSGCGKSRSPKVYKTARTCSRPLTWKGGTTLASHLCPIP